MEVAQAMRTRSFWMIVAGAVSLSAGRRGAFVHMVAYLSGIGYGDTAAALSAQRLVMFFATLGQPLMGVVADRIGGRGALALAFGLLALSLAMLLAATQLVALGLFVLIFGLIVAGPIVLSPLVVAESLGVKRYGSLMGLVGFPFTLGLAMRSAGGGRDLRSHRGAMRARSNCARRLRVVGVVASLRCVPAEWERIATAAVAAAPGAAAVEAAAPEH